MTATQLIEKTAMALASTRDLDQRLRELASIAVGPIAFSTSLGLEDQVLLDAIARTGMAVDIFTLDTGRHFPETLDTLETSVLRYGLNIRVVMPDADAVSAIVGRDGIHGFRLSVEARKACCDVRKVEPLRRALKGAGLWLTGLRREQSSGRAEVAFLEHDKSFGLLKANPLADWTLSDVNAYVARHNVPVNVLHAQGFPSIGCQPCTRAVAPGEDIRAGRWWWEQASGKECGLHNRPAHVAMSVSQARGAQA